MQYSSKDLDGYQTASDHLLPLDGRVASSVVTTRSGAILLPKVAGVSHYITTSKVSCPLDGRSLADPMSGDSMAGSISVPVFRSAKNKTNRVM